jgi:hypothetical protein
VKGKQHCRAPAEFTGSVALFIPYPDARSASAYSASTQVHPNRQADECSLHTREITGSIPVTPIAQPSCVVVGVLAVAESEQALEGALYRTATSS